LLSHFSVVSTKLSKDFRQLLTKVRESGCTIEVSRGGHYRITAPSGRFIFTSQTPSDVRALHRIRSNLRKIGVNI